MSFLDLPSDCLVRIAAQLPCNALSRLDCVCKLLHTSDAGQSIVEQALRHRAAACGRKIIQARLASESWTQALLWQQSLHEEVPHQRVAAAHYHSAFVCSDGLRTCGVEFAHGGPCPGMLGHGEDVERAEGHGGYERRFLPTPRCVPALRDVTIHSVAVSAFHTLALSDSGCVFSWGDGVHGKLGHGDTTRRLVPQRIEALRHVRARCISAGHCHSLAVCGECPQQGQVYSWGGNFDGQLGHDGGAGDPEDTFSPLPTAIEGGTFRARSVAAGGVHSLALCDPCDPAWGRGVVFSWGGGADFQLGHGEARSQPAPRMIAGLERIRSVAAGGLHSLAIDAEGAAWSWGHGDEGRLGHGDQHSRPVPTRIAALRGVRIVTVAAGDFHSLAVEAGGAVWSWGSGAGGALGHGDEVDRAAPVRIQALNGVRVCSVAAGEEHSLAASSDGTFFGWGVAGLGGARLGLRSDENQLRPRAYPSMTAPRVDSDGGEEKS